MGQDRHVMTAGRDVFASAAHAFARLVQVLPADSLAPAADGRLDLAELGDGLRSVGIRATDPLLRGLAQQAGEHAIRVLDETDCRRQLVATGLPTLSLPRLVDGADLCGVYELSELLAEQGVGR